jgi:SAM-dependent methyltransferase
MADSTHPSVVDIYQRHGEAWAVLRNKELVETAWLDRFCAMLPAGGSVLDIGCGSGLPIGRDLARRGFQLTGVDATPAMISLFRHHLPDVPAHLMDMRRLALGQRFSGLLAWDSFFHLSPADQRPMFARFQAHAVPGAALMFTSGTKEGSAIGSLEGDPLYHGSLNSDEYRALLDFVGFETVAHVKADPACGNRTIWLAQQRSERNRSVAQSCAKG